MSRYNDHNWNDLFYYSDGSIFWRVKRGNRIKPGDKAGTDNGAGYLRVKVGGKQYMVHVIIYMMHNGSISEGFVIDHEDNNTLNNNIYNLIAKTSSGNNKNRRFKNNATGYRGVYNLNGGFSASIGHEGKRIHLGWYKTLQEAVEARKLAETKYGYNQ